MKTDIKQRTTTFFVVLLICAIVGFAVGYFLELYVFADKFPWIYLIMPLALFFIYFRIYRILESPIGLLYPLGILWAFSEMFVLAIPIAVYGIFVFLFFAPFEYLTGKHYEKEAVFWAWGGY